MYETTAPVASVYLDTTRASENADKEIELRWRGLREHLAEQGADEATLSALDAEVGGASGVPGPQGEALFASEGRLLGAFTLSRPPLRDQAAWLPVADTLGLTVDRGRQVPYVVVAADREGADVTAYSVAHHDPESRRSFSGSTLHIQKVRVGGWAHKQYQRRSENLWDANAEEAAKDVEAAVSDVAAEVVFVGGDERAIGKLRDHLSRSVLDILVEQPGGGRYDYAALASLRDSVDQALERAVTRARAEEQAEFTSALGRNEGAVEGVEATTEALRRAQVRVLLLAADLGDEPRIWASRSDPLEVSVDRNRLSAPDSAFQAPASALMLRAATQTDAEFVELSETKAAEGTGALLRFVTAQ
ncbi:baeRF2 domain-containing protein [Thermobifida halotolerans]|uniref:baeRF2 domain-containing protein n=1 Tax=Thermobifida halotolerans TaxID=483545 RepID=UPI001F35D2E8|nr:Vms1/Ankzf1 family peptidyl-tRNA hydrolase [Thermobifida halotolerans]